MVAFLSTATILIAMLMLGVVLLKAGFMLGWVPIALILLFAVYSVYKVLE